MKERISNFWELVKSNEFQILPGNLAYSFCLSIIPIVSLLLYLLMSFNLPMTLLNDFLVQTFTSKVVEMIQPVFSNDVPINQFITLFFSIIVMTNGCNSIIVASNTIFGIDSKFTLKRLIKSIFLSIIIILLIAFMLAVPLFGKTIISVIGMFTDTISKNIDKISHLYNILKVPVSLVVMFLIIKLVYIVAPDDRISGKTVNKGALFTTVSWLIITMIYSYYVTNVAEYNLIYGNLTNLVIMLFWLYILAYVFVIGLCLNRNKANAAIEKTKKIKVDEIRKKVREEQKKEQ